MQTRSKRTSTGLRQIARLVAMASLGILAPAQETVKCSRHLESWEELTGQPVFGGMSNSLLKKHLTSEVWQSLNDKHDAHGFTFKQAVFSGCKNLDSGVGVYAGSHDSYKVFADLFDPIIKSYHGHTPGAPHESNMNAAELHTPNQDLKNEKYIVSTRIRVGRNLADYPLGPGLSRSQRKEIESKVVEALNNMQGDLAGHYYSLQDMEQDVRDRLIEYHFLFKEGDRFLEAAGLNRDWPEGRGIYYNEDRTFLVWVNEEDQLRIISMQKGGDIGAVFERLARGIEEINKYMGFAHDPSLGYITSCPTNLGTALRASVHIRLPNLDNDRDAFKEITDRFQLQIRGIHGEHSESKNNTFDISNKRRLGRSEVQLVQDLYDGVYALIRREKELEQAKNRKAEHHHDEF